jgi:hypothetical protein
MIAALRKLKGGPMMQSPDAVLEAPVQEEINQLIYRGRRHGSVESHVGRKADAYGFGQIRGVGSQFIHLDIRGDLIADWRGFRGIRGQLGWDQIRRRGLVVAHGQLFGSVVSQGSGRADRKTQADGDDKMLALHDSLLDGLFFVGCCFAISILDKAKPVPKKCYQFKYINNNVIVLNYPIIRYPGCGEP